MTEYTAQFKTWAVASAIEVAKLNKNEATIDDIFAHADRLCAYAYVEQNKEELSIIDKAKALEIRENLVGLAEKEAEIVDREDTMIRSRMSEVAA